MADKKSNVIRLKFGKSTTLVPGPPSVDTPKDYRAVDQGSVLKDILKLNPGDGIDDFFRGAVQQILGSGYGGTAADREACVHLQRILSRLQADVSPAKVQEQRLVLSSYPNEQLFGWIAEAEVSAVTIRPAFYTALLLEAQSRPPVHNE